MADSIPMSLRPLNPDDWNLDHAQHLLNRAAFGGHREQARELMFLGQQKAINAMIEGTLPHEDELPAFDEPLNAEEYKTPIASGSEAGENINPQAIRRLEAETRSRRLASIQLPWLRRMHSPAAPREKLTMFWHGMITSGFAKVDNRALMLAQNSRLRQLATGDYRKLISELATDPAMIRYLDIDQNRRGKPNENFARELLELFTLGEGNYTDEDIKSLAKVFVNLRLPEIADEFELTKESLPNIKSSAGFDDRMRQINREIGVIFRKPKCGELLCRRLLRFYLTDEPPSHLVRDLTQVLKAERWNVGPTLRVLFSSKVFYAPATRGLQIKSPTQLFIKALTDLHIEDVPIGPAKFAMLELGQSLFNPPNVAGWSAGRSWINSSTLAKRYDLLTQLVELSFNNSASPLVQSLEAMRLIPEETIDQLIDQWFPHDLPHAKRRTIKQYTKTFQANPKRLLLALTRSPEYQLC